jgi:uncharacterized protein YeaO (DUF488 family)
MGEVVSMSEITDAIGAVNTMPRGRKPKGQELIRPTGVVKRSPSTMVNDPSVIPSSALKVTVEHLLNGYDNDIEQISVEINSREARKADLERSREGCLALLSVLAREDSQQATTNED